MIIFGVAGNPKDFYNKKFKKSENMPQYLATYGLDAYEYQCSRGVRVSDEKARLLKEASEKYNISLSVHAPYYISLSTIDPQKQKNSIQYIIDSAKAAKKMGADRIVVHSGALLGFTRNEALSNACALLKSAIVALDDLELSDIHVCPELMGKINQLGNVEEVITLCQVDNRCIPTIDFGHLFCRSLGTIVSETDWEQELQQFIDALGYDRMRHFHGHFSKMEYTKGGEKCHVTFEESDCGPDYETIIKVIKKLDLHPRIICESAGTQSKDAKIMKQFYKSL